MQAPRIGLTTYREPARWGVWDEPADLLPVSYSASIEGVGAAPLLLPPARSELVGAVLDGLHGLVITGGADVDPARYDAERDSRTGPARPDRDGWELALIRAALDRDLPLLAVCRGMQVLNVAMGGALVQHLPDVVGHEAHCPSIGVHARHTVMLADGSRVAASLGQRADVATYHHQAVGRLGRELVAAGWADDGTVEAVELPTAHWVVGVQWHPEVAGGAPLFAAFVAAAAAYRDQAVGFER